MIRTSMGFRMSTEMEKSVLKKRYMFFINSRDFRSETEAGEKKSLVPTLRHGSDLYLKAANYTAI